MPFVTAHCRTRVFPDKSAEFGSAPAGFVLDFPRQHVGGWPETGKQPRNSSPFRLAPGGGVCSN